MSGDLPFGNESPNLDNLNEAERSKPKKKGGRTKETNNARGIPESIRIQLGYDTPPEETKDQRKNRLQNIRIYWAVRWYKYKSIPDWKWTMQFAFNPPYQYTSAMCSQYIEENRHLYYPVPPKLPHPNTLKTPDDFPEEKERLRIAAELKRLRDQKKAAKLNEADGSAAEPSSKKKKKRLRKRASPPPANTEDEDFARQEQAALEDSIRDESFAAADESGSEADDESDPPSPSKKQKLRTPKKKPAEKPPPKEKAPASRPTIDLKDLVVVKPLASKPPAESEKRSKLRHDPAKKPYAKASVPSKPKQSAPPNPSSKRKLSEEVLRQKDLEEALERNILAHSAAEKKRAEEEAARRKKELDSARLAAAQDETKRKLAEAKQNEEKAAAEAKKLAEVEAKHLAEQEARRKATLDILRTKKAEKAARASQKKPVVDMTPTEALPPKQKGISLNEAQPDVVFPSEAHLSDPREEELWDQVGITEALLAKCAAEDPELVDIGEVYISRSIEAMIPMMISQLKDLHSRDRSELKKIHNYQRRAESEPDEEFKQHALKLLQQVTEVNTTTKQNMELYQGKVKAAVEEMVKTHNLSIMERDSRKRKASPEAEPEAEPEADQHQNLRLPRLLLQRLRLHPPRRRPPREGK